LRCRAAARRAPTRRRGWRLRTAAFRGRVRFERSKGGWTGPTGVPGACSASPRWPTTAPGSPRQRSPRSPLSAPSRSRRQHIPVPVHSFLAAGGRDIESGVIEKLEKLVAV
jgi:hypothetical protein